MTAEPDAIRHRRIRAPQADGEALIDPPPGCAVELLRNSAERSKPDIDLGGKSLAALSQEARRAIVEQAATYTSAYRDLGAFDIANASAGPITMAGHQPTLFHPGVWFKNFVLSHLGERGAATAINLVVDNDTLRVPSIRVPSGAVEAPLFENVAFDNAAAEVPYEERPIVSGATFDAFPDRVQTALGSILCGDEANGARCYKPLVHRLWAEAQAARFRQGDAGRLGGILAEARHRLEASLGLQTLELPLSAACDTDAFRWFAAYLLSELPRLQTIYNDRLAEYRLVNHVRSRSHPVPDLAADDDWFEAPLWIWTPEDPLRRRLFCRRRSDSLEITDRLKVRESLPLPRDRGLETTVEALRSLRARGIKIRPRALVTTLFARLLASDLFLHGIGGAKYDELTDAIARQFFGLEPPSYLTVTATFRLPFASPSVSEADLRSRQLRMRELRYHPERFASEVGSDQREMLAKLAAKKRDLLSELSGRRARGESLRAWHHAMSDTNRSMSSLLAEEQNALVAELPQLTSQLLAAERVRSREFSFVLFPEDRLPQQLGELL